MDKIPLEIAEYICNHLSTSELIALSRQSRRWASFTLRFRFASLRIVFCEPHLQWLRYILEETENAAFVQQLNIFANVIPQYADFNEYQWAMEMEGVVATDQAGRGSAFGQYRRTLTHHLHLRKSFDLKEVIDRLSNLQRVTVRSGSICGCVPHRPFRTRAIAPNSRTESLGANDIKFLEQVQNIRLRSLTLKDIDWGRCFAPRETSLEQVLQPWIVGVDHLSLTFVTRFIQAETSLSAEPALIRFHPTTTEGSMKKLVNSGAENLQNFELYFRPIGIFAHCPLRASDVVPAQNLRRLALTNVFISLAADDSLFGTLGQTLECLELKDIQSECGPGMRKYGNMYDTWGVRVLFHLLVRDLRLKKARFCGHFGGHYLTDASILSPIFLDVDISMGSDRDQTVGHHLSRLVVGCTNPELSETENGIDIEHRIGLIDELFRQLRRDGHRSYWVHVQQTGCPDEAIAKYDGLPGIVAEMMPWNM